MRIKAVIPHIAFWVLYIVLWSAHDLVFYNNFRELLVGNAYNMLVYIPVVYLNIYFLVPKFLLKKKYTNYILGISLGIAATIFTSSWNHGLFYKYIKINLPTSELFLSAEGKIIIMTEILVLVGFTMTLYLLKEWYQKERYTREIEQKRLETELNLLRNQMNPHFLFNSLNSIYLMLDKDHQAGREMLLQFSDILSHQLYETNKDQITLKKEVENLKNYIGIEQIRHDDMAQVSLNFPTNLNGQKVAPMLLLPIVENAFKHGQSSNGYWIDIDLEVMENQNLSFKVANSYTNGKPATDKKGIGLANLKRRLELIYPEQHQLEVEKQAGFFSVQLNLKLHD